MKTILTVSLAEDDLLDVTLEVEKGEVRRFALNYRIRVGNHWESVYRVDDCHGYYHEQKLWRSPRPIPIETEGVPLQWLLKKYTEKIRAEFPRYRRHFEQTPKR